jgi:hypothetical protein
METQRGRRAELFALPEDGRLRRSHSDFWIRISQAEAAAILEYAFSDHRGDQGQWAAKIAKALDKAGLPGSAKRGTAYSSAAVKKWRAACVKGQHPHSKVYLQVLDALRKDHAAPHVALGHYVVSWGETFGRSIGSGVIGASNVPSEAYRRLSELVIDRATHPRLHEEKI